MLPEPPIDIFALEERIAVADEARAIRETANECDRIAKFGCNAPALEFETDDNGDTMFPVFRVWYGCRCIGTFYGTSRGWIANAHYRSRGEQTFSTAEEAEQHVKDCFNS